MYRFHDCSWATETIARRLLPYLLITIHCMRRFPPRSRRRKSLATRSFSLSESSPPEKKNDRIEKLRKAELFARMEMAADFDLTRRNLITLRTGLRGSETRNEANRRSRDDNVKVRYEFHRRSFPSEGPSRYVDIPRRIRRDLVPSLSLILYLTTTTATRRTAMTTETTIYIHRITLFSKPASLVPILRCDPIKRL